jgi:predicted small lipoprotein YifL
MMQQRDQYRVGTAVCVRSATISLVAIFSLAGCGSKDAEAPVAVKQLKHEQEPDDPTAKMARAVTIGKSNVPVNLKYEILNKPIVGTPVEIELALIPTFGADSMTIGLAGSEGLTVSTDAAPTIDVVKAAQVERIKFSVQAQEAAVYYVTVTATLYTAGTSSARAFAVPIIMSAPVVATEPAAPAPAKKS